MIEDVAERLPEWLGREFGGLTKEELKAACRHLEISVLAHDTIDSMTRKLLDYHNLWDVEGGSDAAKPPAKPKAAPKAAAKPATPAKAVATRAPRTPPDLRSIARWGGRRYRIRALAQDKERGGARKIPVPWESEVYWLDPKAKFQDVPAPIFHNIVDTMSKELTIQRDPITNITDHIWNEFARFPIQFLGITPGTETLPEDLRSWYAADAVAHDLYANESRDQLERIWMVLTDGQRPTQRDHDRNRDYWLYEILQLLGLTPEQQAAMASLEEVAA